MSKKFDVVIIGSGLGGLECGVILSKEGYNVCVLEQHSSFGGCLQSFKRGQNSIDTGIHYAGSLAPGQILHQYFKYFGVFDNISLIKLDEDFEHINLGERGEFIFRQGYENFIEELCSKFPHERAGIVRYCSLIKEIGESINVATLRSGELSGDNTKYMGESLVHFIEDCIKDPLLREVLAGTNLLCGASKETASLYHHAMIHHSNIEGAYRFGGSSQGIADSMVATIRANGGTMLCNSKVIHLDTSNNKVVSAELEDGSKVFANTFISNTHPSSTFSMLGEVSCIRKAYKTRLSLLPNSYGIFSVYLNLKQDSVKYINKNHYLYMNKDVWDIKMTSLDPKLIFLSSQCSSNKGDYSSTISLMSAVDDSLFAPFRDTSFGQRDNEYKELKEQITNNIIDCTLGFMPEIKEYICKVYSSSPLTYQHYTSTPNGSAYGLAKGWQNSISSFIPPRTKVDNLLLTGQNLNVHGMLGVSLTAVSTCAHLLGKEYLTKKIGNF